MFDLRCHSDRSGYVSVAIPIARAALERELARLPGLEKASDEQFYSWFTARHNDAVQKELNCWWRRWLRRAPKGLFITVSEAPAAFKAWHARPDSWLHELRREMPRGMTTPGRFEDWTEEVTKLLAIARHTCDTASMILPMDVCKNLILRNDVLEN